MTPRTTRLTAKQVEEVLSDHGFVFISQKKGSHKKWRDPVKGSQVIVPFHKGKVLPIGTLMTIIRTSEIPREEWG